MLVNRSYFKRMIDYRGYSCTPTRGEGGMFKISGFDSYNKMLSINEIFSTCPLPMPVDRTLNIQPPLKIKIRRPWKTPPKPLSLECALENRVHSISTQWPGEKINIFWSGGIDSTTIVNAFLRHLSDLSQIRILYSPYSYYEHPDYLNFLKKFPQIELVDLSGETYLNTAFDGMFITGDSGDETHASLDQSFFDTYGFDALKKPWQDFFWAHHADSNFIEFCEQYFSTSGLPLTTVLDARWWYYINSKINCVLFLRLPFWADQPGFNSNRVQGFFDCEEYERYISYNISSIIPNNNYSSWKTHLKNYCRNFDGITLWSQNKRKVNSSQLQVYVNKKVALKNLPWIYLLEDGTRIHTPNLPYLSQKEFDEKYQTTLDYLWNEPDKF